MTMELRGNQWVQRHKFAALSPPRRRGTAAEMIPLLMWQDMAHHTGFEEPPLPLYHEDFYSLYLVRRGRGTHVIDGAEYGVARGDVYVMGPGMTHYFTRCERLLTDTFHFHATLFDDAAKTALEQMPGFHALFQEPLKPEEPGAGRRWLHLTPTHYAAVIAAVEELFTEWASGTPEGTLLTRGLFFRLLVMLSRCYGVSPGETQQINAQPPLPRRDGHEATVAAAVRYLDTHFSEPLRIEQVAAQVFLSPDRFTRVFTETMGRTPRDYLRHLRVERAKEMLTNSDATLTEIAQQSGFGDAAYLTRVLRVACGMPPRELRKKAARRTPHF